MRSSRKYKRPASRFTKGLSALAIMLAALCAAAIIIPGYMDWNRFRGEFEKQASNLAGHDVRIGGDIAFSVLPRPALSLQKVTLANIAGGAQPALLSLERLDARLGVLPLLSGKIQITHFLLTQPELNLEVLTDGRNNWTPKSDATAQPGIRFEHIEIEAGKLRYQNAITGGSLELTDMNMQLSAGSLQGPFAATGALKAQSAPIQIDAAMGAWTQGRASPLRVRAELGKAAAVNFTGNISSDGGLTGNMDSQGTDLYTLIDTAARIRSASFPPAGAKFLKRPYQIESAVTAAGDAITLDKMRISLDKNLLTGSAIFSSKENDPDFDITLSASNLDLDALRMPPENPQPAGTDAPVDMAFEIPRDLTGRIGFSAASIKLNNANIRDLNIAMSVAQGAATIEALNAQLPSSATLQLSALARTPGGEPHLTGQLVLKSENLRGFLGWLDIKLPAISERRLTRGEISTQFNVTKNLLELTGITAEMDASKLTGGIAISLLDRLGLGVDLHMDQINADSYFAEENATVPVTPHADDIIAAAQPYLVDALAKLDRLDCNFKLSVDALTYRNAPITKLNAEGALLAGAFTLTQFTIADIAGSAISMSGTLSNPESGLASDINFRLASNDPGGFARVIGLPLPVTGAKLGATAVEAKFLIANAELEATIDSRMGENFFLVTGKMGGLAPGILSPVGTPPALTARLLLGSSSLAKFSSAFGLPLSPNPAEDAAGISLNAELAVSPDLITLNTLNGTVGSVPVQGNLQWRRDGPKPVLTAQLSAGDIFAGNFLGADATTPDNSGKPASAQLPWSGAPLEFAILKQVQGELKIDATRFNMNGYDFVKPSLTLAAAEGQISLQQFDGMLWGGTATASASLKTMDTPEFSAGWKLQGADMKLAAAAAQSPAMTGRLNFTGSVKGVGASTFALIASLEGQARLTAAEGVIKGIDLAAFSEGLGKMNKAADFPPLAGSILQGGETPYRRIDIPFDIRQGIAHATDSVIAIDAATGAVEASIDLPRYWLNAEAAFKLNAHADAPPIGIAFIGPLNNPQRTVRTEKMENFFTERLMSQSLQRVINNNATPPAVAPAAPPVAPPAAEQPVAPPAPASPKAGEEADSGILQDIFRSIVREKKQ